MFKKLACSTLIGVALTAVTAVQAQTACPAKAIRIVVPFAAGGTSDILARTIGQKLTESWGQPVVVDNRAGANGNVGADHVAKSAPDGYTLLLSDVGALAINPSVYPNIPYDVVKDFVPVALICTTPNVMVVSPNTKAKTNGNWSKDCKKTRGCKLAE